MSIIKRKHFLIAYLIIFISLTQCQLKTPNYSHGINSLKNRENVLIVNKTNKNDIIKLLGKPHSVSIANDNKWFYFERVISRGKMLKLGQNVLKTNDVLEIDFDKYGVLISKKFYKKEDMEKVKYSKKKTVNNISEKSVVDRVLSSLKQKMYRKK